MSESDMTINPHGYVEDCPFRLKRIVWCICNALVYPLLSLAGRRKLLNAFGAKIKPGHLYRSVRVYAPWNLEIGEWTCIGPRVEIYNKAPVKIGAHTVVSQDAYICTASHDVSSRNMKLVLKPIFIGNNAWVAAKTILLPGVTIDDGAVIGCGSVVTKDVQAWHVVGGNPARFIKKRELIGNAK